MDKRTEKKVEALRNGESVKMNHKLLSELQNILTKSEYKRLEFLAGYGYIAKEAK